MLGSSSCSRCSAVLIFSSSPRDFGSIAYEITGSGNLIGRTRKGIDLVAEQVARQRVFQFGHGGEIAGVHFGDIGRRLALQQREMAEALGGVARTFCTVESALTTPEMTRNIVMRPANGSAIVFHTNTAAGAAVRGRDRDDVLGSFGRRRERALGRRRHVGEDRVEQRLHADVGGGRGAHQREHAAGGDGALQIRQRARPASASRLEELLHQRIVGLGDHLDQRVAGGLRAPVRARRGSRPPSPCRCRRTRRSSAFIATRSTTPRKCLFFADRQLDRDDRAAEHAAQRIERAAPGWRARDPAG